MNKQNIIELANRAERLLTELQSVLVDLELDTNSELVGNGLHPYYNGLLFGVRVKIEQARRKLIDE